MRLVRHRRCAWFWRCLGRGSTTGRPAVHRSAELDDAVLAREIKLIWIASDETYVVPRMTAWLVKQGFEVNHKRVGRIMRELGLEGESGRRRVRTTIVDKGATAASITSDASSTRPPPMSCGVVTSRICTPARAGSTWPPSSTCSPGG